MLTTSIFAITVAARKIVHKCGPCEQLPSSAQSVHIDIVVNRQVKKQQAIMKQARRLERENQKEVERSKRHQQRKHLQIYLNTTQKP